MASSHPNGVTDGKGQRNPDRGSETHFVVEFPQKYDAKSIYQDEEFADVSIKGKIQRIRIHDYQIMFAHPGLYEFIIHEQLECDSPRSLVEFLRQCLSSGIDHLPNGPLTILDVAAGNGIVGSELRKQLGERPGIENLVGTDLLESARSATLRDRPETYDEFLVANLVLLDEPQVAQFKRCPFDVATVCAALGPGKDDLPLEVFDAVIDLLCTGGLLVFTVNEENKRLSDSKRWKAFLESLEEDTETHWKDMRQVGKRRYNHRKNVQGEWIVYTALIYQKIDTRLAAKD